MWKLLCLLLLPALTSFAAPFTHTEARHTHSIALTPDGRQLLALNSPDARLSVFDVGTSANLEPTLIAEIPVGLEPVAVCARTNDEVWVVNELSDTVSIVSLSARTVVATLKVTDEPADIVFAQGKAFISCARNNLVRVFNASTRQELPPIAVRGLVPSALAVNSAGTRIYAAFLHSGNRTTILPRNLAPAQPAPTNPNLPAPPQTGLIVPADDPRILYTVVDHDAVEIDAAAAQVLRYFSGAGTNILDVAVHPQTSDLWLANTEARNLVRFEPALRGHVADHRLTRLTAENGAATVFDLNPGTDYATLPNPAAQHTALAQPSALAFSAEGDTAWVAAFGSDRIAQIDALTGSVLRRLELRSTGQSARQMRGPRALAWKHDTQRLYVLNKLSNTITVIGTTAGTWLAEVPVGSHDPMPASVKEGRGFLFDARLSGNGLTSCATCHPDADRDGIAWDLGDPAGEMLTVKGANLVIHDPTPRSRVMHPMKGPMTTQTLRGLSGGAPFHWRGDRSTLPSFNATFAQLMGGPQLPVEDIDALSEYLGTLRHHPNPNLLRDGRTPATLAGGDPLRGADLFTLHANHCNLCHEVPRGTNNNIDLASQVGSSQPIKNPSLRTVYQRVFFNPRSGQQSLSGFGLNHDGTGFELPRAHPYALDELGLASPNDVADVTAFVLCFPTETKPAVGESLTVTSINTAAAALDLTQLETLARQQACDLVARGILAGELRSFLYNRATRRYEADKAGESTLTQAELLAQLTPGDTLNFLATPPGEGSRYGGDRDENGTRDRDETIPVLGLAPAFNAARLRWPAAPAGWRLEATPTLHPPAWSPVTSPRTRSGGWWQRDEPLSPYPARFFRLQRTW